MWKLNVDLLVSTLCEAEQLPCPEWGIPKTYGLQHKNWLVVLIPLKNISQLG
jgi:hypothetical protein